MTRRAVGTLLALGALVAGLIAASPAVAWADGELTVRIEAVDDASGGGAVGAAVVTVLDGDGRPVVGLTAEEFALLDAGESAAVRSITRAEDASVGIAVVLAIDTSLSMQGVIDAARTGANSVVQGLAPEDRAAVVSFSRAVETVQPLTDDAGALEAGVASLVADGPTALHDAVLAAVELARDAPLDRRVVILLTDGVDDGSEASRAEALAAAATEGVPIYAIGFGAETDVELLTELATASDGSVLLAPDAAAMLSAYEEFASVLRSQYIVAFDPTPAGTEVARSLEVTVTTSAGVGTAQRTYTSSRPAVVVPPPAPPAPVEPVATASVVVAEPAPAAVEPATSSLPVRFELLAGVIAAFAVAIAAVFVIRRRRRVTTSPALLSRPTRGLAESRSVARTSASLHPLESGGSGRLVIAEGDLLVLDGSGSCGSSTEATYLTGPARLWWRDGKLMLHRRQAFGQQSAPSWATLETGDVIEVGADRFRVEIEPAIAESRSSS